MTSPATRSSAGKAIAGDVINWEYLLSSSIIVMVAVSGVPTATASSDWLGEMAKAKVSMNSTLKSGTMLMSSHSTIGPLGEKDISIIIAA